MNEKNNLICHLIGLMGSVKEALMRPMRRGLGHTRLSLLADSDTETVTELLISSRFLLALLITQLYILLPPPNSKRPFQN